MGLAWYKGDFDSYFLTDYRSANIGSSQMTLGETGCGCDIQRQANQEF
jgi:hypothetical protein